MHREGPNRAPSLSPCGQRASARGREPLRQSSPYSLLLSAGEHELLDPLFAVEIDDRPEQLSLLVGTPRVDTKRVADARVAARFVNMSVQGQRRLMLLDRGAHRLRPARNR